jgi:hypothetical protein
MLAVLFAYDFCVPVILGRWLGRVSNEQTVSFPYPLEVLCSSIPRVVQNRLSWWFSERFYGNIVKMDSALGLFVIESGVRFVSGTTMTITLSKIDEKTTRLNIICKTNRYPDFGATRILRDAFLKKLYNSAKVSESTN